MLTVHIKIGSFGKIILKNLQGRNEKTIIGLLFSNPSTADVFHINRSVLMAGILNEVLFMVV